MASELQIVVFALGQGKERIEMGVPIEKVQEINKMMELTKLLKLLII